MEYIIEMLNITKEFPGVRANDNITLKIKPGEIHALLGENGAGKSTLMSILFGLYQAEKGIIKVRGKQEKISNPNRANDLGIGMVHQHFKLVDVFTVLENIILGMETTKRLTIDKTTSKKKILELSKQYHLHIEPDMNIEDITVGMQQRVEILKMLYRNAEILIFDEPTSVLTPREIIELMKIMRNMAKEGKTILFITHKLKEIKEVADRCTVIRNGKLIETVDVADVSLEKMAELMVGRAVSFETEKEAAKPKEVTLEINNLNVMDQRKLPAVKDVSLKARKGEILGIAGVDGNGQTQLVEAITGLRKIESGQIKICGKDISKMSIRKRYENGMGHVPEDRHRHGLVLEYSLEDNMILQSYYLEPYSKAGLLKRKAIRKFSDDLISQFDVRAGEGSNAITGSMSGGNQQKAILAREISRSPSVMIVVQPTRGLDVGAIEYIHKRLIAERDSGKTILLVSLEIDEILNLSDRVAVMFDGKIAGELNAKDADEFKIGQLMAGLEVKS